MVLLCLRLIPSWALQPDKAAEKPDPAPEVSSWHMCRMIGTIRRRDANRSNRSANRVKPLLHPKVTVGMTVVHLPQNGRPHLLRPTICQNFVTPSAVSHRYCNMSSNRRTSQCAQWFSVTRLVVNTFSHAGLVELFLRCWVIDRSSWSSSSSLPISDSALAP